VANDWKISQMLQEIKEYDLRNTYNADATSQ